MSIVYYTFIIFFFSKILLLDYIEYSIYDRDILISLMIIFAYNLYTGNFIPCIIGLGFGAAVGLLQFILGYLIYKSEAYGSGDVFLLAVIGAFLGNTNFIGYFFFVHLLLGLVLLIALLINPSCKNKAIPLAPFYIIGIPLFILMGKPSFYEQLKFLISLPTKVW